MADNYSVSKTNQDLVAKSEALKKIHEHIRDYLSLTLTVPLGNTALANVHTNQWLFTDLPKEFDLANFTIIGDALKSSYDRYEGYIKNRWYIEGVDITVDSSGKAEMKLTLNAFASSYSGYAEEYRSMQKAYTDAENAAKQNNKNTSNAVSNGKNDTIKNGWWGKWVTEFVKKNVGSETDTLKKCKKMYQLFHDHMYYKLYYDAKYTYSGVNSYESAWKRAHLNCGDGANILCAFYECCGATSNIYLGTAKGEGHYVVKCTINGKDYWTDQSGAEGAHNTLRGWNQTYGNLRGGANKGKRITTR